jgi:hypothetical protein
MWKRIFQHRFPKGRERSERLSRPGEDKIQEPDFKPVPASPLLPQRPASQIPIFILRT